MPSIRDIARGATMHGAEILVKDTKHIPEEKFCFCPMGCAKTAEDILRECAGTNARIAASLRGEDPSSSVAYLDFQKKVDAASGLEAFGKLIMESSEIVRAAIDGIADADLDKQVKMPWGAMFLLGAAILLPSQHMNYHDGQINYIQTLLGDSAFHWHE